MRKVLGAYSDMPYFIYCGNEFLFISVGRITSVIQLFVNKKNTLKNLDQIIDIERGLVNKFNLKMKLRPNRIT